MTFDFCLLLENFNFVKKFSKVMARFFIFHIIIPCDKICLLVFGLTLTFDFKKKYINHNRKLNISFNITHEHFL